MKNNRLKISPEKYFKNWNFDIGENYWEIFGIKRAEWIDLVKAKPLREKRKIELMTNNPTLTAKKAQAQAVKEIRPKIYGWGQFQILASDFSEGYLFKHKEGYCVQLIGFKDGLFILLFFDSLTNDYFKLVELDFNCLLEFLKSGDSSKLIDKDPSTLPESELKYLIKKSLTS